MLETRPFCCIARELLVPAHPLAQPPPPTGAGALCRYLANPIISVSVWNSLGVKRILEEGQMGLLHI